MTRHRSPRGRGAPEQRSHRHSPEHGPRTVPVELPPGTPRGGARHRSPASSALRRGAVAAGVTTGALAVVGAGLPVLSGADADAGNLALSTQSAATESPAVTPAAAPAAAPVGAASADLIKAVDRERRAESARAAQAAQAAAEAKADREAQAAREAEQQRAASLDCGASDSYGGVADAVQEVGNAMECVFPGHDVLGVGSRGNASDHPGGQALDFMTTNGDAIADCMVQNADALGVKYVIWDQQINTGSGWDQMEDRGGATANHEDHVHISFDEGGSPDVAALRGCGGGGAGSGEKA